MFLEHLQDMGWTGTVEVYGNDEDDGDCDGVETEQDCNDSDSMLAFDEDQMEHVMKFVRKFLRSQPKRI